MNDSGIEVRDTFAAPTVEFPEGSWMHTVDGEVTIATGCFAVEYPGKPSPYFHGGPPFFMLELADYPWKKESQ